MKNLVMYKQRRFVFSAFLNMALMIKEHRIENTTFITILKGGMYTASNVLKNIFLPEDTIIGYLGLSSYNNNTVGGGIQATYIADLTSEILEGRNVWIIDDICDTSKTLERAIGMVQVYKPASIKTAVLIDKAKVREQNHFPKPDVVGFTCNENKFLVGCGMGIGEKYRTLDSVYEYIKEQ